MAEVVPVPGLFALMRITRLCSQRLLERNLITVFSTVNTLQRTRPWIIAVRGRRRSADHQRVAAVPALHLHARQHRTQCKTAVFKVFAAYGEADLPLPPEGRGNPRHIGACHVDAQRAGCRTVIGPHGSRAAQSRLRRNCANTPYANAGTWPAFSSHVCHRAAHQRCRGSDAGYSSSRAA